MLTPAHWINPWEGGVRITRGKHVIELGPGIHFKVPLLQRIEKTETAYQTLNLPPQSLTTKDDCAVHLGGVVPYRVKSVVAFFTKIADQDTYLRDKAMSALEDAVSSRRWEDLVRDSAGFKDEITKNIKSAVYGKGYEVDKFHLTDKVRGRAIRLLIGGGETPE